MTRAARRPAPRLLAALALALAAALVPRAPALAQAEPRVLPIVAFAGASNWPVWVGQDKGLFAREGLDVRLTLTPNSRAMAGDLYAGTFRIALTSIDNVVAYDEGQGEVALPGPAEFAAFMGVDDGMLSLMAAPDVGSVADLKGREVSVDSPASGFAFALRAELARAGLKDGDVRIAVVGGGAQRLAALREGWQAATLLNAPLDILGEAAGLRRLARLSDTLGAYQGIVGAARRGWLAAEPEAALAFMRGFRASVAWLADPANGAEARAILIARSGGTVTPALADAFHARLLDPARGIARDLAIDPEGVRTVLRLRATYASPSKPLADPAAYIDASLLARLGAPRP